VRAHSSVGERSSHVPVQELGDLLREIDADGNGRIDLDEFIVLMQLLT
jgi:Ca2+-binding EF-hand superfamily protein